MNLGRGAQRGPGKDSNSMQVPILSQLLSRHAASTAINAVKSQAASATPKASSSSSSTPSSAAASPASSATITANDFLSLLVTEMKNQDPTQQTDPMQYITQLVDVNSLQQLVSINQDLTPTTPTTPATSSAATGSTPQSAAQSAAASSAAATAKAQSALLPLGSQGPASTSASQAVAQSLGRSVPLAVQAAPAQLPPTHVAVQPEVLRAIEMSIPGATMTGASTLAPPTGGMRSNIP